MNATLTLPWPPSVNHYYRHVGPRVLISKDGRRYREAVAGIARRAAIPTFRVPVEVDIDLLPPDSRRRDADNSLKCTLDSLTHAGVYEDDSLVRRLTVTMKEPLPPDGMAIIRISEHEQKETRGAGGAGPPVP
jgi:crossover junction endodeoxyribonuclease RusA